MAQIGTTEQKPKEHKRRLRKVLVPGVMPALDYYINGFRDDIQVILDSGLTVVCLSNSLGVSETTVHRWRSGIHRPRALLIVFCIQIWADKIRGKQIREQKEAS